jgi:predicted TIM-barrel fold metal-dependent hydrolase
MLISLLGCSQPDARPSGGGGAPSTLAWIDTHVHLRSHRLIPRYVELQERYGMSAMVLQSAPNQAGLLVGGRPNRNAEALLAKAEHPERFYVFGGLDLSPALRPDGAAALEVDLASQVDRLAEAGVDGLKLYFNANLVDGLAQRGVDYRPDSAALAPVWEGAREHQLPLLIHIDEAYFVSGSAVLAANPDLTFIVTHLAFAGTNLERLEGLLSASPRVYLDVGHYVHLGELVQLGDPARAFLETHADRILQSSDLASGCELVGEEEDVCPSDAFADDQILKLRAMLETAETIRFRSVYGDRGELEVQGLDLPGPTLEKLYSSTALGLLGASKPLGCAAARREAEVLLERTTQSDDRERLSEILTRLDAACR